MATIVTDLISHLQCGETIAANDAVYIDDITGKVGLYNPTIPTQVFAGIAKEAGVLDDFIRVVQTGRVKGFSGLTPGQFVYASTTVPGAFQLTEPIASQKVILGIAKSATELVINGGLGIKPGGAGGGGGGLDVYHTQDMEGLADASGFTTGNDVVFLNAGSMAGTLALDEVSPISGAKSLEYTQAAGSLNDYFASEVIDVELKQQNNDSGMTLYFEYDGADDDIKLVVWDETNSEELTTGVELIKTTGKATRYALSFYVPVTCTQIRWGAQVLVENIGAVLKIDDVEITSNPFVESELIETQNARLEGTAGFGSTATGIVEYSTLVKDTGARLFTVETDSTLGTRVTMLRKCEVTVTASLRVNTGTFWVTKNQINVASNPSTSDEVLTVSSGTTRDTGTWSGGLSEGDIIRVSANAIADETNNIFEVIATSSSPHVLTPARAEGSNVRLYGATGYGSSGTKIRRFTTSAVNVGSGITYTSSSTDGDSFTAKNSGFYFISYTDGFSSVSNMSISLNASSLTTSPAALTNAEILAYETAGGADFRANASWAGWLDAGDIIRAHADGISTGSSSQTSFSIVSVSEAAFLAAIPTPKVAYLKDVKTSGTNGGDFNSGSYVTRVLNTVEGDSGFVSLSTNQFTLQPGKYQIEAHAPGHLCGAHKAKVYNVTNSVDAIIGAYVSSETASGTGTRSVVDGTLTITEPKVFELRHRCTNTKASNGLGFPCAFGDSEIYAVVMITKLA